MTKRRGIVRAEHLGHLGNNPPVWSERVGTTDAVDAPRHRWQAFGLRWEYECRRPRGKRWGVSDGMRGVEGSGSPLSAYRALRKWREEPALAAPSTSEPR